MSHADPGLHGEDRCCRSRDDVRTMLIHPYLIEDLIRRREQQLRRSARRYMPRRSHPRRCPTGRQAARRRAGWALVETGLVLVQGCGDPQKSPERQGVVDPRELSCAQLVVSTPAPPPTGRPATSLPLPPKPTKESTMSRNTPTPDHQRPGHLPASASPAPGSADLIHRRQL